jgi:hypothetical protein
MAHGKRVGLPNALVQLRAIPLSTYTTQRLGCRCVRSIRVTLLMIVSPESSGNRERCVVDCGVSNIGESHRTELIGEHDTSGR